MQWAPGVNYSETNNILAVHDLKDHPTRYYYTCIQYIDVYSISCVLGIQLREFLHKYLYIFVFLD